MPKGMSKCEYCGEIVPSALKSDHIENRCVLRKTHKRLIQYIKERL